MKQREFVEFDEEAPPEILPVESGAKTTEQAPVYEKFDTELSEADQTDIATISAEVDSWKAPDDWRSTLTLIHHGIMHKISKGHNQIRTFYLFDHVLVYGRHDRKKFNVRGTLPMCDTDIRSTFACCTHVMLI